MAATGPPRCFYCEEGFVMGMCSECHGHIFMNGADYREGMAAHKNGPDLALIRAHLAACRDAGITYFRDGGDALGVSLAAREMAAEFGIRYVTPAFAIHRKGRYGGIVGFAYETMEEYRQLLRRARREGADFIKLMFSGILYFDVYGRLSCPPLPAEEIRALVDMAHGEGFAVMAHVNGPEALHAALEAGTDSIEHGYFMDEADLPLLAEGRTIWVPTMAAIAPFAGRPGCSAAVVEETLRRQGALLRRAAALGALIATGSDSGAVGVPHGAGIHTEEALLTQSIGDCSAAVLERGNRALQARFPGNM